MACRRRRLEAVEKIGAHRADGEQRAVRVLQRMGQQRVEALAGLLLGEGEQLLELVDYQQEGDAVPFAGAQPVGQRVIAGAARARIAQLRHLAAPRPAPAFGQHRQRIPARHHRADEGSRVRSRCAPTMPLLDHWQHAGLYQRRFAVAAVALDLQPAAILPASRQRQVFRVSPCWSPRPAAPRAFRRGGRKQPGVLAAESVQTEEGQPSNGADG